MNGGNLQVSFDKLLWDTFLELLMDIGKFVCDVSGCWYFKVGGVCLFQHYALLEWYVD